MNALDPIEITPDFYQLGTPFFPVYLRMGEEVMIIEGGTGAFLQKALSGTKAYHHEMIDRVANGDDRQKIAQEKGDWVLSISSYMPYKVMAPLCQLLISFSEAEAEHPDLSFEL